MNIPNLIPIGVPLFYSYVYMCFALSLTVVVRLSVPVIFSKLPMIRNTIGYIISIFYSNFRITTFVKSIYSASIHPRLVPDNTVHKGTSKIHKTYGKITHFVVHVPSSIFYSKKTSPLHSAPIQLRSGIIYL